ncbi:MAG: hypothetical protein SGI74_09070 [Oligoflexia bacterium]|nr:hypothetical protein [Oligoflexia bacterium]
MKHLISIHILILFLSTSGCAILGSNDDPAVKSVNTKFSPPDSPYEKSNVSSADQVWQSKKTGSTIAVNSMCQKYADLSLKNLEQNILTGIENLKVIEEQDTTFDEREASRILAEGTIDGVPIRIDLLIFKKNNCTYDLAYISRPQNFTVEKPIFEKFLSNFHAP